MNKVDLTKFCEALCSVVDAWNDAGEDEDTGRSSDGLVLIMHDDGSGRLGNYWPQPGGEIGMNTQIEFDVLSELAEYLVDWVDDDSESSDDADWFGRAEGEVIERWARVGALAMQNAALVGMNPVAAVDANAVVQHAVSAARYAYAESVIRRTLSKLSARTGVTATACSVSDLLKFCREMAADA